VTPAAAHLTDSPLAQQPFPHVAQIRLGDLPVAVLSLADTAALMIEAARTRPLGRPLVLTSANGEVISRCRQSPELASLFRACDLISADGQPMVVASRLFGRALPERVATTDLFPEVARRAEATGLTFYLYGASEAENRLAVERVRRAFPRLRIVGHAHGYHQGAALGAVLDEIDAAAPDILWVALGVPREQEFALAARTRLPRVGVIKTSGGLFNFLSGSRHRAPGAVQSAGLEWLWRLAQEPRRLFWRYALTNPHALYLLLTRSG
jgi:N-acetylglucosaminyldiphosphoundecaprenol N-acetyl-beta-D-mannosaminyltransferase